MPFEEQIALVEHEAKRQRLDGQRVPEQTLKGLKRLAQSLERL